MSRALVMYLVYAIGTLQGCATSAPSRREAVPTAKSSPAPLTPARPLTSRPLRHDDTPSPNAPTPLPEPKAIEGFHCERHFIYQGEVYNADSYVRQDGENLRPYFKDVPEALAQLDSYQKNRQRVRTAAYVGSTGLVIALTGFLLSRAYSDSNGNVTDTGNQIKAIALISGLGMTAASVIFGFSVLTTNESHLKNAVGAYNQVHPDKPIELRLSTGFTF